MLTIFLQRCYMFRYLYVILRKSLIMYVKVTKLTNWKLLYNQLHKSLHITNFVTSAYIVRNSLNMTFVGLCIFVITEESKPTRCHLLFYCTSYRLNMFRALLCPSSGFRDYNVDYHIGRFVLGFLQVGGQVQLGWSSVLAAACIPDTTPA